MKFATKAQYGGGGNAHGISQFANGHVHDFVTVFDDIVVDQHLKIVETGDGSVGEHTHNGKTHSSDFIYRE